MLRRVETGLSLLMVSAVTALYVFGTGVPGPSLADAEVGVPGSAAVLLILAIIGLNGLFVGAETAVDLIRPVHVKHFR
ncbi:MAG TPA: hypothetical protein VG820_10520, partial [Fimbriimonadaceae bacterium]|nr:hypothetical protein [Fimbriimonadaceae bacterium]